MTEAISWKYRRSFLTPRNDRLEPGVFVQALNKTTREVRNCQDLFLTFLEKHPCNSYNDWVPALSRSAECVPSRRLQAIPNDDRGWGTLSSRNPPNKKHLRGLLQTLRVENWLRF